MEGKICSLCLVRSKPGSNLNHLQLLRLADAEGDALLPPRKDEEGINRDIIYYDQRALNLQEGAIAFIEWEPYFDDGWKQSIKMSERSWIEVLEVHGGSPQQLLLDIRQGVRWGDGSHDLLLRFDSMQALYWPRTHMRLDGNGCALPSDVESLSSYALLEELIKPCASELQADERHYYAALSLGEPLETMFTSPPETIVGGILGQHIRSFCKMSRSVKKAVGLLLDEIDHATVMQEIEKKFACPPERAEWLLKDALTKLDLMLYADSGDGALFQAMIENDAALVQRMLASVEAHWQADHQEKTGQLQQLQQRVAELDSILTAKGHELSQCEASLKETQALETRIQEKVKLRLEGARGDISTLLDDYAWLLLPTQRPEPPAPTEQATSASPESLPQEIEETENVILAQHNVMTNLGDAGIFKKLEAELARYLMAAYHSRTNLLIAGAGGLGIARALSTALCGVEPTTLYPSVADHPQEVCAQIAACGTQIVVIPNALGSNTLDHMMTVADQRPEKMFIFLTPFAQSLALEPRGLYQYMLPLFADCFLSDITHEGFICADASRAFHEIVVTQKECAKAKAAYSAYSDALMLESRQETMIASLSATASALFPDIAFHSLLRAMWLPLAICLGRGEQLLDEMRVRQEVSQQEITLLERYIERGL